MLKLAIVFLTLNSRGVLYTFASVRLYVHVCGFVYVCLYTIVRTDGFGIPRAILSEWTISQEIQPYTWVRSPSARRLRQ